SVRAVAPADPQLVLLLLEPAERRAPAVGLEPEAVLVSGADLADRDAAFRAAIEAHQHRAEIFARYRHRLPAAVARKRKPFRGRRWLQPRADHRRQLGEHRDDALADDVLDEIAPVRPDVAHRGARTALVRLEPPREIGRLQQPVLQVGAVDEVDVADLAGG